MSNPRVCPHCTKPLEGLGTFCWHCEKYADDPPEAVPITVDVMLRQPPGVHEFRFPLPPNIANAEWNWRKKRAEKKKYWALLDERQLECPAPPAVPWEFVRVTMDLRVHQIMDMGNAFNRVKWIEDWLTTRGYIVDDSPKHWEYTGLPTQRIDRKDMGVTMTLVPGSEAVTT